LLTRDLGRYEKLLDKIIDIVNQGQFPVWSSELRVTGSQPL